MSVSWKPCDHDETQRILAFLTNQYEWSMADAQGLLIQSIQADARSEGYRLVNPRYGWVINQVIKKPGDDRSYCVVCDSVERMSVG